MSTMKAYAIYTNGSGKQPVAVDWPKEWYSPLKHGDINALWPEEHAAIYGVPAYLDDPELPGYYFDGCAAAASSTELYRRMGYLL